jgi:hypothetical protein
MSEREPDDTPETADAPTPARAPGDYYYDDATGYEIYKPDEDDEAGDEDEGADTELATPRERGHPARLERASAKRSCAATQDSLEWRR